MVKFNFQIHTLSTIWPKVDNFLDQLELDIKLMD